MRLHVLIPIETGLVSPSERQHPQGPCLACHRIISHVNDDDATYPNYGFYAHDELGHLYIYCWTGYKACGLHHDFVWQHCDVDQVGRACSECGVPSAKIIDDLVSQLSSIHTWLVSPDLREDTRREIQDEIKDLLAMIGVEV